MTVGEPGEMLQRPTSVKKAGRIRSLLVGVVMVAASCGTAASPSVGGPAADPSGVSVEQLQVRIDLHGDVGPPFYVKSGDVRAGSDGDLAEVPVSFASEWNTPIGLRIPSLLRFRLEADGTVAPTAHAESALMVVEPEGQYSVTVVIAAGSALDPGVWEFDFDVPFRRDALDRDPEATARIGVRVEILSKDRLAAIGPFCDEASRILGVAPNDPIGGMLRQMTQLDDAAQTLPEPDRARLVAEIDPLVATLNDAQAGNAQSGWSSVNVVQFVAFLCDADDLIHFTVQ